MKRRKLQTGAAGAALAAGGLTGAAFGSLAFGVAFGLGLAAVAAFALRRKPPAP